MKRSLRILSGVALLAFTTILSIPLARADVSGSGSGRARFSWQAVASPIVSGYKVYWGTESGVYTHTIDAANVTTLICSGFSQGVTYFATVTAYSNTGEESDYSTELSFVYDNSDRLVLLEAENGVLTAPMQIVSDGTTTGVAASPANSAAATTLSFDTLYAKDYYVWCRVLAASASADSMFVTLDQQAEQVYYVYGESSPPAAAFMSGWTWSRIQVSPGIAQAYPLEAGSHSIRFRCRDNTWLDRVVIVSNSDFVPSDALPRSGDFMTVVGQPQGGTVVTTGMITLTATLVTTGPLSVQWLHNGVAVPNSSQMSLTLSNVQTSDAGTYTLSAWNTSATLTTQPATLTVLLAAANQPFRVRSLSIAAGGSVTLQVDGAVSSALGVYVSSDLVNWSLLTTQSLAGTTLTITDPGAVGATKRFYRLADNGQP